MGTQLVGERKERLNFRNHSGGTVIWDKMQSNLKNKMGQGDQRFRAVAVY
jgi:hypothetical protein